MHKCEFCVREFTTACGKGQHQRGCDNNPNKIKRVVSKPAWNKGLTKEDHPSLQQAGDTYKTNLKSGKFKHPFSGRALSVEHKEKLSEKMKDAHAEGRAWNIGKSRWNNEPSYPEKFFMKVIENEFNDKNYINEYPVGIYSIDFAWVDKKLAIEIDGDQHQRFEEYKLRDERKDSFLESQGWKVLRIVWKDMFNNTKEQIKICKNFIGPLV